MAVETNVVFNDLKNILDKFDFNEAIIELELARLNRLKTSMTNNGKLFMEDEHCDNYKKLYEHGLNLKVFKIRRED